MNLNTSNWRTLLGAALLLLGGIGLLTRLGIIPQANNLIGPLAAVAFLTVGVSFLYALVRSSQNWWAAIPGAILTTLGLLILLTSLIPAVMNEIGGGFFLAGISIAFWLVYLLNPQRWWAVIPGGVMATLSLVAVSSDVFGINGGAILMLGLAITFGLLTILPTGGARMTWPLFPAGGCLLIATIIATAESSLLQYVLPVGLIMAGVIVLVRSFNKNE